MPGGVAVTVAPGEVQEAVDSLTIREYLSFVLLLDKQGEGVLLSLQDDREGEG